jgi:hypothetical protein
MIGVGVALAVMVPSPALAVDTTASPVSRDDAPRASAEVPSATPDVVPRPSRARGSTVARIVARVFARRAVRSKRQGWRPGPQTAWSRRPQTLLVLGAAMHRGRRWLKVLLPVRPNGRAGWIAIEAARPHSLGPDNL